MIARLNVGGPSLHVSYLSSELDRMGYETTLVAGRVGAGEGSMEYVARQRGIEPLIIPQLQREIAPIFDVAAIRAILGLIKEHKPHILHTHTAKAGAVGRAAARLAGRDRPRAVVHTFHGHVLRGYFNAPVTAAFRQVERALARDTDALIAVSPEVRDDLVRLGVAPAERIAVVRLGLDLDARTAAPRGARAAERAALGIPDDRFVVGWLGRMTEIKRVDDLLEGFARLRRHGGDADLVLVGDGPLRSELEDEARRLKIADRTHFVGYREDVGGVGDVVRDGVGGFLVRPGDPDALARRLEDLAADEALRRRLGAAGAAWVRERYSVPRLVSDVDILYRTLLEVPRRAERPTPALTPRLEETLPPKTRARIRPAPQRLRVLLLSQYFPPEIGATQSRMQAFAEYLSARGHDVTVVAEFPNHPYGVIPERYRGYVIDDDRANGYRVLRVWVKTSHEKTQGTRIAFYLSYMALATAVGPIVGPADVVVATSPPLFTGVAGVALARMYNAPLVLDVRDLWPAAAEALSQISDGAMRTAALGLERFLYRQSAAVVAVTRPFCEHVDSIRRQPPATTLIPNGTLELFFDVDGDRGARAALGGRDDAFVVTFAGTHGLAQALPRVLDAAARVSDDIVFAFIGEGPVKDALQREAGARGLPNVRFRPQIPLHEMPGVLAASDALLVPLSAHPTFADFVPSKMIDFMAAGRPVLLSAAGEAARVLDAAGAGVAVPPEDADALAGAATWLASHPAEAREMGARGRAFAARRLRVVQAERLEQVLFDVVRAR